jgi:ABC-2 type transport system ATP-binding protein
MAETATSSSGELLVEASGLTRRFGAVAAVSDVSFSVRRGEMFGLIGPDGAGKTTTLRMVLGLLKADAGTVRTCGLDPFRERRKLSGKVGYLSQKFSLYGDLSVDENVAFFAEVHDVGDYRHKRDALLDLVRMTPFRERLAARLSGGMKQKLALVSTLVHTPELLVLDEPTTGVDVEAQEALAELLAGLHADLATTVLYVSHEFGAVERFVQRILLVRGGIVFDGPPFDLPGLWHDPSHVHV